MAVTIAQLYEEMRFGSVDSIPTETSNILERLIDVCEEMVAKFANNAPTVIKDRATIMFASYLYDTPHRPVTAAFRLSGAKELLSSWQDLNIETITIGDDD